jgi:hypothetical protein
MTTAAPEPQEPEITTHTATIVLQNQFTGNGETTQSQIITGVTLSHYYDHGGFKHDLQAQASMSTMNYGDTLSLDVEFKTGLFAPTDSWTLEFTDSYGDLWSTDGYNGARLDSSNIRQNVNVALDGPWYASYPLNQFQTYVVINSETITAITPNYPG